MVFTASTSYSFVFSHFHIFEICILYVHCVLISFEGERLGINELLPPGVQICHCRLPYRYAEWSLASLEPRYCAKTQVLSFDSTVVSQSSTDCILVCQTTAWLKSTPMSPQPLRKHPTCDLAPLIPLPISCRLTICAISDSFRLVLTGSLGVDFIIAGAGVELGVGFANMWSCSGFQM